MMTMTAEEYRQSDKAKYETAFREAWQQYAPPTAPALIPQYPFAKPARGWLADFAILPQKVLIEIDGAIWANGRHTRGSGYVQDAIKINYATTLGYRVFRFTPDMLREPKYLVDQVLTLVCGTEPPAPPKPPKRAKRAKKHYKATVTIMDNHEIDIKFKNAHQDYIFLMAAKVQALEGVTHTPINETGFAVVPGVRVKLTKLRDTIERLVQA